ncbi:MAG: HEAT repeat domain-containing protein [Planctomycetes bacterium]|nr:HEAT repeat domain-containing protein [Planctomycetota bacterium]
MVRLIWIGPSVIALALTATAWGQSAAPAPGKPGERVIKVQEDGKPAQRCRVLRTWQQGDYLPWLQSLPQEQRGRVLRMWQQPGGGKAYEVQSLETGELLTIVASASPSGSGQPAGPVSMTIIHWGSSGKPSAGSPMPPVAGTAQSAVPPSAGMMRPMPSGVAGDPLTRVPRVPVAPVVPTRRPLPAATGIAQSPYSLPAPPSVYAPVSPPAPMTPGASVVERRTSNVERRTSNNSVGRSTSNVQRSAFISPVRQVPAAPATVPAQAPVPAPARTEPSLPVAERVEPADTRVNMPPAEGPRTVTDVPRWPLLSRLRESMSPGPRERIVTSSAPTPVTMSTPPQAPVTTGTVAAPEQPPMTTVSPARSGKVTPRKKPRPHESFATERPLPIGEEPMPTDRRATMPAPIQTSVTPIQATSTDAQHAQPGKRPELGSPHDGHAVPVVEKMAPADTRVTLPPAESTPPAGSTMWPAAHCDQSPGPLGEMRSRKEAAREEQRQQEPQPKYGLTDRIAEHRDKGPRVVYPEAPPVLRPTLVERIFGRKKSAVCEPQVCEEAVPLPAPVEEKKTDPKKPENKKTMRKADVEPAKPVDNRQSWGKYEPLDPVLPNRTGRVATSTKPDTKQVPKPPTPPTPKADEASWLKPSASKPAKTVEDPDLPHARKTTGRDPLTTPGAFTPFTPDPVQTPDLPARKVPPSPSLLPPPPPVSAPDQGTRDSGSGAGRTGKAPRPETNSPGSGSVFAAGDPHYVPVPIVTMPASGPPPAPPSPSIPQPPQAPALNRMVNGGYVAGQPPPGMSNAFTEPGPTRPIPSETTPSDLAVNAFSGPAPAASALQSPPNPALAGGYPPVPQGYAPGMSPQSMPDPRYAGMPPNFTPASYYNYRMPPPSAMTPPAGYAQPAQAASTMPSVAQMLQMLRDSDFPSQREWAAEQLAGLNGRSNPEVVQCLVTAAKMDPAPMVRVCCVRSLMKMQANTVPVVTAVQELKNDADPRVRDAVAQALAAFGVAPAAPGTSPIQPVGGH